MWEQESETCHRRDDGVTIVTYRGPNGLPRWLATGPDGPLLNKLGRRRTWSTSAGAKATLDGERACAGTGLKPRHWYTVERRKIIDGPFVLQRDARAQGGESCAVHTGVELVQLGIRMEDPDLPQPDDGLELPPEPGDQPLPPAPPAEVPPLKAHDAATAGRPPAKRRKGQLRDQMWDWIRSPANKAATLGDLANAFGVSVTTAIAIRDGAPMAHGAGCPCHDCALDG